MASLLVGVDIGGTFTDCVVLDRGGRITATKSPSTPENFAEGMLAAMRMAAERLGLSFERFCRDVAVLTHGTTVGTNTLIQRKGARVVGGEVEVLEFGCRVEAVTEVARLLEGAPQHLAGVALERRAVEVDDVAEHAGDRRPLRSEAV